MTQVALVALPAGVRSGDGEGMGGGGTGSGPACVTRDSPPRSGAAIFRPAGPLARDPTPPSPHQARVPALTCSPRGYSLGAAALALNRLEDGLSLAENWRAALLGQTASAFPPGRKLEEEFLRRRHRHRSCCFPVLTRTRRERMEVAEDVRTAVALLHAFPLLLVRFDGDDVSHLGSLKSLDPQPHRPRIP